MFTRRTLKLIAISYAVKTLVFGAAWLAIPDLPERAMGHARAAWSWAVGSAPAPQAAAPLAAAPR
jgi:hypothetical protein